MFWTLNYYTYLYSSFFMWQNYSKNRCPVFVINTVIVEMIQSTAQASLTPRNNVLIITSWRWWGPLPRGLSQIINCSVLIFSWPSCSERVCVFPYRGADPTVGYHFSSNRAVCWDCQLFSSGLILQSTNILLQKLSNELWLGWLLEFAAHQSTI